MIKISLEREVIKIIIEALDIAAAWHKHDKRFEKVKKLISDQLEALS